MMALYLEGKAPLRECTFSQGGNSMSRDIKYIGMDVHKEAIVIVVLTTQSYRRETPSQAISQNVRPDGRDRCVLNRRAGH
jgi:hypothetical protein